MPRRRLQSPVFWTLLAAAAFCLWLPLSHPLSLAFDNAVTGAWQRITVPSDTTDQRVVVITVPASWRTAWPDRAALDGLTDTVTRLRRAGATTVLAPPFREWSTLAGRVGTMLGGTEDGRLNRWRRALAQPAPAPVHLTLPRWLSWLRGHGWWQPRLAVAGTDRTPALIEPTADGPMTAPLLNVLARGGDRSADWRYPGSLTYAGRTYPLSPDGLVRLDTPPARLTVDAIGFQHVNQLTSQSLDGRVVVIGDAAAPATRAVAAGLAALAGGHLRAMPWWLSAANAVAVLALLALALWAAARFTPGAVAVTGIATGGLLAGISTALAGQLGLWLNFGPTWVFGAIATTVALALTSWRSLQAGWRAEADEANIACAELLLEAGKPERALNRLEQTTPPEEALDTLLATGRALERRRLFDQARSAYRLAHSIPGAGDSGSEELARLDAATRTVAAFGGTMILSDGALEAPEIGRYRIERELGRGAAGVVYLAFDPRLNRRVALKTLAVDELEGEAGDDLHERFFREAELAGRLHHPNIVTVHDVGEQDDIAYIAMDYVEGGSLATCTDVDHLLELPALFDYMRQVAEGLAYAHEQQVVHRDIKPGNLLVDAASGRVLISDFGIARIADLSQTRTGTVLGSPSYMSPEQIAGRKVGPASDIFSLGVTFYQLLTGALPFTGDSVGALAWQIGHRNHTPATRHRRGSPRAASRIINQALQKKPGDRFDSAAAMAAEFARAAKSL